MGSFYLKNEAIRMSIEDEKGIPDGCHCSDASKVEIVLKELRLNE